MASFDENVGFALKILVVCIVSDGSLNFYILKSLTKKKQMAKRSIENVKHV